MEPVSMVLDLTMTKMMTWVSTVLDYAYKISPGQIQSDIASLLSVSVCVNYELCIVLILLSSFEELQLVDNQKFTVTSSLIDAGLISYIANSMV